jgi:hypothetical protein
MAFLCIVWSNPVFFFCALVNLFWGKQCQRMQISGNWLCCLGDDFTTLFNGWFCILYLLMDEMSPVCCLYVVFFFGCHFPSWCYSVYDSVSVFSVLSYAQHSMNSRSFLPDSTASHFLVNIFQNFFLSVACIFILFLFVRSCFCAIYYCCFQLYVRVLIVWIVQYL